MPSNPNEIHGLIGDLQMTAMGRVSFAAIGHLREKRAALPSR